MKKLNFEKMTEVFGYGIDIRDLAQDIWDRVDDEIEDEYEAIYDAINSGLIYYDDQWTLLRHYFSPTDKNISLGDAIDNFAYDILQCVED